MNPNHDSHRHLEQQLNKGLIVWTDAEPLNNR
jgi:hypothetical protein